MSDGWKRHGTTIALVLACAAGGAYVWLSRGDATTGEKDDRKQHLLPVFRGDDLTEVAIARDGETFRLFRKDPAAAPGSDARLWRMDKEEQLADQFAVNKAMQALEYATFARVLAPKEVDRKAMGLESPRFVAKLVMGKLRTTVSLGGPAASPEGAIYADVDGRVVVVRKEALFQLDVPRDALRTRTLVPYLSTDLAALEVSRGPISVRLSRGQDLWLVDAPGETKVRVDRRELDPLIGTFADLSADHFLSDEKAKELQKLAATVTLSLVPRGEKEKGLLVLGGECPDHPEEVVVRRLSPRPISACANRDAYQRWVALDPLSLPDRRAFSLREDEVESLEIKDGDKVLELARKDKGFHQRKPTDATLAREQVLTLLRALTSATSSEMPRKGAPLAKVRATVTLTPATGGTDDKSPVKAVIDDKGTRVNPKKVSDEHPPEVVEIGEEEDGKVPVLRKADGARLLLSRDDARAFTYRSSSLRSTKVVDVGMEAMRKIVLHRPGGTHVLERTEAGMWTVAEPKGYAIDLLTVGSLADQLGRLTADAWVADKDDGTFGLAHPRLSFELSFKEGEKARTVKVAFGDEGKGGVYGRVEGEDGVFVAPKAVLASLTRFAIDTTTTVPPLVDGAQVALVRKGKTLEVKVVGDKLEIVGKSDFPQGRLAALFEALRDLKAEEVVHLGAARKDEGLDAPRLEVRVGGKSAWKLAIGAGDAVRGVSVFYAKKDGVDAVFVLAASRVRTLEGLLE